MPVAFEFLGDYKLVFVPHTYNIRLDFFVLPLELIFPYYNLMSRQYVTPSWVGERTENQPDPGTVLFVRVVETVLGADLTNPGSTL